MTTNIFLTGDRSAPPELAIILASSAIGSLALQASAAGEPVQIWTGDNVGFEEGVRKVAAGLGLEIQILGTPVVQETGKPDWDQRHRLVDSVCEKLYLVHGDPLSSSIGASALSVLGDKAQLAAIG